MKDSNKKRQNASLENRILEMQGRIPPSNKEMEYALVFAMVSTPEYMPVILKYLRADMFYYTELAFIFKACSDLYINSGSYDFIILYKYIEDNYPEEKGVLTNILSNPVPYSAVVEKYCMILLELYIRRQTILILNKYLVDSYEQKIDILDIYENLKKDIDTLFEVNKNYGKICEYESSLLCSAFHDESVLSFVCDRIDPILFTKNIHRDILLAYKTLVGTNTIISIDSVYDSMVKISGENAALEFKNIVSKPFDSSWQYKYKYLVEISCKNELHGLIVDLISSDGNASDEVFEQIIEVIEKMKSKESSVESNKSAVRNAINEIHKYDSSEILSYIPTHNEVIDNVSPFTPDSIIVIAGTQGSGKTRFTIRTIKSIASSNKNVAFCWFSMEDSKSKVLRAFIASDVNLTDQEMTSKNYKLTSEQMNSIERSMAVIEKYDIEWVDEPSSISTITSTFTSFCKKRKGKMCFLIVDNFMLITDVSNSNNPTQTEDSVMSAFRALIKKSNKNGMQSSLILLHHITKEAVSSKNKDEAYRPKISTLKGSTRIPDAANIVILLNNLAIHKDLIKHHSTLPDIMLYNSENKIKAYKRTRILSNLIIGEIAKNRDGEINDGSGLMRYIVDLSRMKFSPLKVAK